MTTPARNEIVQLERVVGNREDIGFQLLDINGNAINISGLTLKFRMVRICDGAVIIAGAACEIDTAASGLGHYEPTAADMAVPGVYAMYIIDDADTDRLWPYDGARWILNLKTEQTQ